MTVAEEIRALRAALKENTATFGARWLSTSRAVEDWEQGRRVPHPFVLQAIRALASRRAKPVKSRQKPGC